MKRPAASGQTELVIEPLEFLRRLAALVPPPRVNLVLFFGFFAPNASLRKHLVPKPPKQDPSVPAAPSPACPASTPATKYRVQWADAMVRYLIHLRSRGVSPRTLSGIASDLNAAGWLVMSYDAPKAKQALSCFDGVPQEVEYTFKISNSPNARARYQRSLEGFSRFLEAEARPTRPWTKGRKAHPNQEEPVQPFGAGGEGARGRGGRS